MARKEDLLLTTPEMRKAAKSSSASQSVVKKSAKQTVKPTPRVKPSTGSKRDGCSTADRNMAKAVYDLRATQCAIRCGYSDEIEKITLVNKGVAHLKFATGSRYINLGPIDSWWDTCYEQVRKAND